jgi:hypothetical protein
VVVIGERHAERIQRTNYDLSVALGNLHFKLGHYRFSARLSKQGAI